MVLISCSVFERTPNSVCIWRPLLRNCGLSDSNTEITWFCTERLILQKTEKGKQAQKGNDAHRATESIVTRERTSCLALVHRQALATLSPWFRETSFPLTIFPDTHTHYVVVVFCSSVLIPFAGWMKLVKFIKLKSTNLLHALGK